MKYLLGGALIIVLLCITLWLSGPRIVKTVFLIARVTPYERFLSGAPSILILGDSTGYGTGASNASKSIAGRIGSDFPSYSITNNSKNGRTIEELVSVTDSITGNHELILLQIGGNDILHKRDSTVVESELRTIVERLSAHTENLVMLSTGNVGGASALSDMESAYYERITRVFRDMFIQVSTDTTLTYVDLFVEPENDPFVTEPEIYLSVDGLHPSNAGYDLWYQQLRPILLQKLTE